MSRIGASHKVRSVAHRTDTFAKLFFLVSFTGLFMYIVLGFYTFHSEYTIRKNKGRELERLRLHIPDYEKTTALPDKKTSSYVNQLKYILMWGAENRTMDDGQSMFIFQDCANINCYVATNRSLLDGNYTNFDAIVFNQSDQEEWTKEFLPKSRLPCQRYVFYSKLPSKEYPICENDMDNYFNWTWSYKLGSNIFTPFIHVSDSKRNVIAPNDTVAWKEFLPKPPKPFTNKVFNVTKDKKALAWVIKDCKFQNSNISRDLRKFMKAYKLDFDIYGCDFLKCPKSGCHKVIRNKYYFSLVYDTSFSEDYVTGEVLNAYTWDTVPIVYGGANYKKFLPDKSYINFKEYDHKELAALLNRIIKSPSKYRNYFIWKNKFTLRRSNQYQGFCKLCEMLNKEMGLKSKSTIFDNFREWWYGDKLPLEVCNKNIIAY